MPRIPLHCQLVPEDKEGILLEEDRRTCRNGSDISMGPTELLALREVGMAGAHHGWRNWNCWHLKTR